MIENFPHHSMNFHYAHDFSLITVQAIGLLLLENYEKPFFFNVNGNKSSFFIYCTEGKAIFKSGQKEFILQKDSMLLINVEEISQIELKNDCELCEFFYLEFSRDAYPVIERVTGVEGNSFKAGRDLIVHFLDLYQEFLNHRMIPVFFNSKSAHSFLMDLIILIQENSHRNSSAIRNAKQYIDNNFHNPDLSLDMISEQTGISKFYLCKEFKLKLGLTLNQYLKEKRLKKAAQLLKEKQNLTLHEVAVNVGYANSSYFGKVFRKYYGITPNEYRKEFFSSAKNRAEKRIGE